MSLLSHANVLAQSNQPIPRRANRLQHTRILPIATDPPRHTLGTQNLARPRGFEPLTSAEGELAPSPESPPNAVAAMRPVRYQGRHAPVAQLDRALPSKGRGQRFESSGPVYRRRECREIPCALMPTLIVTRLHWRCDPTDCPSQDIADPLGYSRWRPLSF